MPGSSAAGGTGRVAESLPGPSELAPAQPQSMQSTGALTVGIDLGGTKLSAALVDSTGQVLHSSRQSTDASRGVNAVVEGVARAARSEADQARGQVRSVGVGIAAQVDTDGVVRFAPNLRWRNVPLRRELESALDLPVVVLNDVRAATAGEWLHGGARGESDLVCLFLGTGLGGGVVSGSRILEGASNAAGELGHQTIVVGGRKCTCGNLGCLEAYVGGWAIAERAKEAVASRTGTSDRLLALAGRAESITATTVAEAARAGDPLARRLIETTSGFLAAGLVGIANSFNPRLFVYGGGVCDGVPELFPRALEAARPRMLPSVAQPIRAVPAQLGEDAATIGAAAWARRALG